MHFSPWTILGSLALALPAGAAPLTGGGPVVLRASSAETVANGTLEHAVILVEDGVITAVGEDLPVERGIPIIDLPPGWVVMPGLINPYSRVAMDGKGKSDSRPQAQASVELYASHDDYQDLLEAGFTTLGQYPAGTGIPGQAVALNLGPDGPSVALDPAYLKIVLNASSSSKRMLRDGFEEVDEYLEKEAKNREKWDKEQEKKKKSKKKDDDDEKDDKKDDDEKEEDKKKDSEPDVYVPLVPDPEVQVFMHLRDGTLSALVSIDNAAEYLHLVDAIGEEEFAWGLRVPLTRDINLYEVTDKIGERGLRVVVEPSLTLHPGTMRQRNLSSELARAGAKLCFIPRFDSVSGHEDLLLHAAEIVAAGLERGAALRALTLEPAELLGLGEGRGSIEEGKRADLIFLDGDPFEVGTKVRAVMLDGEFVTGEVPQ